jgi:uncharacterized protein (TIGR02145 family)
MKKITIYFLTLLVFIIGFLQKSCEKDEENNSENKKNPPVADFTIDQTSVYIGAEIQFTDKSTNNPESWSWDFGDGNTSSSSSQNPLYTYLMLGNYTVSLTVTNGYVSDTETKNNFITVVEKPNTIFDSRDNKTYRTVKIGEQWWMAENLAYDAGDGSWMYDNITIITDTTPYGRLYIWETACDVCPEGWHLPSDDEWKELEIYLGMNQSNADSTDWRGADEGIKIKSTYGWYSDGEGTNSSGFSALPGGYRHYYEYFDYKNKRAYFWSSTQSGYYSVWCRHLHYYYENIYRGEFGKMMGFSVRCVKD